MIELTLDELEQFVVIFEKIQKRADEIIRFKNKNDNIYRSKNWDNRYSDDDCSITQVNGESLTVELTDNYSETYDHDIKFEEFISNDWNDKYIDFTMGLRVNRDWDYAIITNDKFKTEKSEYERLKKIYEK